jgi:hypothetical protein
VSRAPILPLADGARPRWSVMIPAFDCAGYLEATLRSVLAQDPGPEAMQFEVVDDHSTADDPQEVVTRLGGVLVGYHLETHEVGDVWRVDSCLAR